MMLFAAGGSNGGNGNGPLPFAETGRRLGALMLDRGLTQKDVAARTGLSQGFLSKFFSGGRDATFNTVVRVAMALEISLDEFCGIVPQAQNVAPGLERRVAQLAIRLSRVELILRSSLALAQESELQQAREQGEATTQAKRRKRAPARRVKKD